jgi:cobyrinic acid a,c-diamide synthase
MKRIIIGGTKSGCGKTTVTCAILSALKRRSIEVSAFKCGPDYIDPMFHRKVIGVPSHNLDSFFCDRDTILYLLDEYGSGSEISVIEGVMGFYDGEKGSAYSVSELTETSAVIVIDCKGMSDSIGAVMSGFLNYRSNRIAGFIFDRLPVKLIPLAKRLCDELGTKYYGCLPKSDITIESRHLGLVTANEISDIRSKLDKLGELAEQYIEIDKLLETEYAEFPHITTAVRTEISTSGVPCTAAIFCIISSSSPKLPSGFAMLSHFLLAASYADLSVGTILFTLSIFLSVFYTFPNKALCDLNVGIEINMRKSCV